MFFIVSMQGTKKCDTKQFPLEEQALEHAQKCVEYDAIALVTVRKVINETTTYWNDTRRG